MKNEYFCCCCASKRERNLVILKHMNKSFCLCLRCYLVYIVAGFKTIEECVILRDYTEAKSYPLESYRYGSILDSRVEKILVRHFKDSFSKKTFKESTLRASLKKVYTSLTDQFRANP